MKRRCVMVEPMSASLIEPVQIIGGSGFIGTRLCRLLADSGREFTIVDRNPSRAFPDRVFIADVRDLATLVAVVRPDAALVNLAAEHRDDVRPLSLYDEVNVEGARNICLAARKHGINKIVFTSSVAVYGFAEIGTGEDGRVAPFNDYGRTKYAAEQIYGEWQSEAPDLRTLVIVRPTVVFGEQNRGNVYNLLRQISSGRFMMIGTGRNRKSIAYVENVVAFLDHALDLPPGRHLFNYVDKPDFTMDALVRLVFRLTGRQDKIGLRFPVPMALAIGRLFDAYGHLTKTKPTLTSIRVRKFCADSVYSTASERTGFRPPVTLEHALERTVRHEFIEPPQDTEVFFTE